MPQLTLEDATLDYRVVGPEDSPHPPVLFVHGILVDHRLWSEVADELARRGFRCVLPDWPLGSHTRPAGERADLSPMGVATMVHDTIAALGLENVTLVGNDTGGGICQLVVDAYPESVGRLVLTNCDAFDKFPPFPFNLVFATLRGNLSIKLLMNLMRVTALRHSPIGFGMLFRTDPALTASWVAPCQNDPRIRRELATLLRNVAKTDLTDVATRLPRFTKPVTVVWGMLDRSFTPALGRRLAALFPDATWVEVPDARTFVAQDAPQAVADAISSITAKTDA
ncbi:alpha/beta fold hydrolase [Mycolicibacterium arseniciresistens]|uniref:Alpha/beta hydrolase n=1 Tax=Mycolicibacterium arseniciresistens TaxID=3062257 RepID=A0ABT8UNK0_9MYCO|nr:alpha/beta hydrolase [Mycolicibacterium arseniciresistens]MDO3639379.1 alpha/beta hydrolase [Mycolicibacterium arseniciresistens]